MAFRYACFISYRHAQQALMRRFVEEFSEALESELEPLTTLPVYRDTARLEGGDFYNKALARSLCESVCMIMIYTGTYFDKTHRYCAREFVAMSELESKRLDPKAQHGLIIPVVYRGLDDMPEFVKDARQVYRFESFSPSGRRMIKDRKYDSEFRRMAAYIAARCGELKHVENDCDSFSLPEPEHVEALLGRVHVPPAPFPGRQA